jgi:hypothetical protein
VNLSVRAFKRRGFTGILESSADLSLIRPKQDFERPRSPSATARPGARLPVLNKVFMIELAAKVKAKDLKYLGERVKLPFKIAGINDGNEERYTMRKPPEVAKMLDIEDSLLKLLSGGKDLEKVKAGGCDMGEGKALPEAGPPVLVLKGNKATLTAPPTFCGGQGDNSKVYELEKDKKGVWILVSRGYVMAAQ